ncbi:tRNA pseudouridine synthase 1 [Bienertia sinuspersici]
MSSSSTTTNSDDDGAGKPVRYKRRKIAIFFAYCGVGYQVPEADRGQPKRFDWARSARTDKGVSAVGQSDISSNNRDALLISGENGVGIVNSDGFVQSSISLNNVDALVVNDKEDSRVSVEKNNNGISSNSEAALLITEKKESNVCSDDNGVAGTHNFHNFTTRKRLKTISKTIHSLIRGKYHPYT